MSSAKSFPSSGAVAKGAAWAAIDNWIQQGSGLITFIVVGSLIGPHQYGVMAMGLVYHLLLASILRDTFGEALIQRQQLERDHYDTIFWTLTGLGLVLALISLAAAPPLAAFFGEALLDPVIRVMGLTFPFLGAANFYRSLLRRQLNFKALALRSAFACGLSAPLAIVLAIKGFGIWSLLSYQAAFYVLDLVAVAFQSGWRPRLRISPRHFRDLAGFSGKTIGLTVLAGLGSQFDRFLIGYFAGAGALGLYSMARRIVDGIDQTVIGVINAIALPAFSRVQNEHPELRRQLLGLTHFAMIIACPVYAGVGLVAPKLIAVLLPDEWLPTAGILAILAYTSFFVPATIFLASSKRAIGRAGLLLGLAAVAMGLRIALCLAAVLAGYGVTGVVLAIGATAIVMLPLRIYFAKRTINLSARSYVGTMRGPLAATFLMMAAVYALERLIDPLLPDVAVLVLMVGLGVLSYAGALRLFSPHSVRQILAMVSNRRLAPAEPSGPTGP